MEKEKTKPVDEVRFGAIVASVWKNESKNSPHYNVTITRLYKDGGRGSKIMMMG